MQLNEILEENTVKAVSEKTNISAVNIDALNEAEFSHISRVKTMGFLSILEREYSADLSKLREEAKRYYDTHSEDDSVTLGLPISEPKKGKSKLFMFLILFLIGYALWYAFSHFDQKKLNAILPFSEETLSKIMSPDENTKIDQSSIAKELSIENSNIEANKSDEEYSPAENNSTY